MKTEAAKASAQIKQVLKAKWPQVKFSVKSSVYSGGDSVHISWIDGPTTEQVQPIVRFYEYGTFDGMTDSYNMDNVKQCAHQAKYVMCNRDFSDSSWSTATDQVKSDMGLSDMEREQFINCWFPDYHGSKSGFNGRSLVYQKLHKLDLTV